MCFKQKKSRVTVLFFNLKTFKNLNQNLVVDDQIYCGKSLQYRPTAYPDSSIVCKNWNIRPLSIVLKSKCEYKRRHCVHCNRSSSSRGKPETKASSAWRVGGEYILKSDCGWSDMEMNTKRAFRIKGCQEMMMLMSGGTSCHQFLSSALRDCIWQCMRPTPCHPHHNLFLFCMFCYSFHSTTLALSLSLYLHIYTRHHQKM